MPTPSQRLAELGIVLSTPPAPLASYVPAVQYGGLIQTSGQLPTRDGTLVSTGLVGRELDVTAAQEAARQSVVNALAAIVGLTGDLDSVVSVLKVTVFVAAVAGFDQHAVVANGASDLLGLVFQDDGRHARSAVGVASLPLSAPVEVELLVAVQ